MWQQHGHVTITHMPYKNTNVFLMSHRSTLESLLHHIPRQSTIVCRCTGLMPLHPYGTITPWPHHSTLVLPTHPCDATSFACVTVISFHSLCAACAGLPPIPPPPGGTWPESCRNFPYMFRCLADVSVPRVNCTWLSADAAVWHTVTPPPDPAPEWLSRSGMVWFRSGSPGNSRNGVHS